MGREPREVWAKRVERWRDSGLTATEFAAETGINPRTLTYWRWRLGAAVARRGDRAKPAPSVGFVEVVAPVIAPATPADSPEPLEVILPGGLRISVPVQFDSAALRRRGPSARAALMLPAQVRIFVCTTPQDMRRSFDALALATKELLGEDPQSGALYVFVGKSATRVKVLWWDRNGYCLLYKRLHRALFHLPIAKDGAGAAVRIDAAELARLLAGVDQQARRRTSA